MDISVCNLIFICGGYFDYNEEITAKMFKDRFLKSSLNYLEEGSVVVMETTLIIFLL